MFRFNFSAEDKEDEENVDPACKTSVPEKNWIQAKPHYINRTHLLSLFEENTVEEVTLANVKVALRYGNVHTWDLLNYLASFLSLKYLKLAPVLERIAESSSSSNVKSSITDNTDLVPAVYEGGLKIWECTWDLLNYLASSNFSFKGSRVLELGCGAALPAIYTLLLGANVTIQDYNEEVIDNITVQNVMLNSVESSSLVEGDPNTFNNILDSIATKATFYSGDWGELEKLLTDDAKGALKFDLILTSETIYNPECHEKLLNVMTNHLEENGKILLAAKSYYFGVGGGIHQFCDLVKQKDKLHLKTVFTDETGVKREILELTLK